MNYANSDNHNFKALLAHADPIAKQLFPAIATYGFLSIIPGLGPKNVFESGIMEFMASMTLPFSFAFAVIFCGLSHTTASRNNFLFRMLRKISGYWASFCISLCAATLGVVAGLFFPYILANGIFPALKFLCIGLFVASGYGIFAHLIGVFAFSNWDERWGVSRSWVGIATFVCGAVFAIAIVHKQLVETNVI